MHSSTKTTKKLGPKLYNYLVYRPFQNSHMVPVISVHLIFSSFI